MPNIEIMLYSSQEGNFEWPDGKSSEDIRYTSSYGFNEAIIHFNDGTELIIALEDETEQDDWPRIWEGDTGDDAPVWE